MMEQKHRVLIVSRRLLVAQGLSSLLTSAPRIADVTVVEDLYEELIYSGHDLPDVVIVDLPSGASYDIGRPVSIRGVELRTIVLQEGERNGQARIYLYMPGSPANLTNLMSAILWEGVAQNDQLVTGRLAAVIDSA